MQALTIIESEHHTIWRLVATIDAMAELLEDGNPVEEPFFTRLFDYIHEFVDQCHHAKEDQFLFAAIRLRSPEGTAELDRLEAEHDACVLNLQQLRALLQNAAKAPGGKHAFLQGLRTYTQDLKRHMSVEEQDILPMARKVLFAEDWKRIDAAFGENDDPLFGRQAREEYRELFSRIAALAPDPIGLGSAAAPALVTDGSTGKSALLRVVNLETAYGRIQALKGISFEIHKGELVTLIGANGAGKTTTLRTLSGIQPVTAGHIFFGGQDISHMRSDLRVRQGICQSPEGRQVFSPLSIEDNLRLGAYLAPKRHVKQDLERIYTLFPVLKEKRDLAAGTLSGGQQQMLAIGRALMGRPSLLLLDEPSMGLSPLLVEEVFNVIKNLKKDGITILLVEQNAADALAIADRAYVLETGRIVLTGTGTALSQNEDVRAAYLGM
jgi:branched-chain amino acid transport system ATP-binding protein